jgi:hypothetical protein
MDILHSTSKLVQHASFSVHSLLSLWVYNIDQRINHSEKWVQAGLRSCKPGILLKVPYCSVWWLSTCRFGDSVPKFLESDAAGSLAEFKLIFLLNTVLAISSNFCYHSTCKTNSDRKRKSEFFNSTLRVHPTAYSNFVSLLHKLEIVVN